MANSSFVPKPDVAGKGVVAVANTRSALSNIRRGPGLMYQDIGDIMDNALVVYYPDTKTASNWIWLEKGGLKGWVYAGFIKFIPAIGAAPSPHKPTPYDGKVAVWHWKGSAVQQNTISEAISTIKANAPNVSQVWVKITNGVYWMSEYDNSEMAISGASSVDQWVSACQAGGLEFHAWCVPKGLNVKQEAAIIVEACARPGVQSLILDIEPYADYWQGGAEAVRPFMLELRRGLGTRFHIGMSVDPRRQHYHTVFPGEWSPFIDSIHPQTYWKTFRTRPEDALASVWTVWGGFNKPIIPVLQGSALASEQTEAHTLSTQVHGAKGLSWWRYGVISQWTGVNKAIELTSSPADESTDTLQNFADEVVILPSKSGFRSGTYTGKPEFSARRNTWGWDYLYVPTEERTSKVWAEWRDELPQSGLYEIAVFIPNRNATTKRARYKVHGIVGTTAEVVLDINQHRSRNAWVALGVFDLDKNMENAGRVFLNDVTGETDKEIAFDAVRFRRIVTTPPGYAPVPEAPTEPRPTEIDGVKVADGYDSPVGASAQRGGERLWPKGWLDATPFGKLYFIGTPSEAYHTGADLNFGRPYEDKGMACYACASGIVTFAARLGKWGNLVVIRHDPLYQPSGQIIYSRYAHVQNMRVTVGERVARGQRICEISDAFGRFVPHLHFDLSATTLLETSPGNWPKLNYDQLARHYIDPRDWISRHRP
ncbi:MAG: peptidoglycan DD-metalloendopeptidase family protein [Chloroflexota bacterium]|nr:peptidoglycan DD-metalloendopeptidase family protein [Chloroflexota bacterium]MDE2909458.1 peptidoglycan DD-metalloendopeptidase family protein [Chloroflexota bacterium]